jgi:hypothetical protein
MLFKRFPETVLLAALMVVFVVVLGAWQARADCFEEIGCTDKDKFQKSELRKLSCESLWHVRNRIYDENGYCFKTDRAKEAYDNSDCTIEDQGDVPLNAIERANVEAVKSVESAKGCS